MSLAKSPTILQCIGNTSLVPLRHIVPRNGARVLLKLEAENPTGSMKDRAALAMIETPERDGRLPPRGPVVEYTGGTTGVSLSLICAVTRHPLYIVSSDAFAREKLDQMAIMGAEVEIIPSDRGHITEHLIKAMIEGARVIVERTGGYWTNQLSNTDQLAGYHALADEMWDQADGRIDAFVQSVGTAASLRGIGERLRQYHRDIQIVAVEPAESAVLAGRPTGAHRIEGIGAGFVVPLWRPDLADAMDCVFTDEANAMALRLAREEGIFAGTSTGGNVIAALRAAERLGAGATVVTLMVDTGMKYLGTYGQELAAAPQGVQHSVHAP
jgi:cysteine synthase